MKNLKSNFLLLTYKHFANSNACITLVTFANGNYYQQLMLLITIKIKIMLNLEYLCSVYLDVYTCTCIYSDVLKFVIELSCLYFHDFQDLVPQKE